LFARLPRMDETRTGGDGRRDFDFWFGRWRIHNRRLASLQEPGCTDWVEFEATGEARPILRGLGNLDEYWAAEALPEGTPLAGTSLRLFDPETRRWRIWWASSTRPGRLDPPVEGSFVDGCGQFFGDDALNGKRIEVRFDWTDITPTSARWEQAFSYDGGRSWETNWIMTMTREA
jgi:hypothetical protein